MATGTTQITNSTLIPRVKQPAIVQPTGTVTVPFIAAAEATPVGVYALAKVPAGAIITQIEYSGSTGFTGSARLLLGYEYKAAGQAAGQVTYDLAAFRASATLAAATQAVIIGSVLPFVVPDDAESDFTVVAQVTGAPGQANNIQSGSVTYTLQTAERFVPASGQ